MPAQSEITEKARQQRMLRKLRTGDRVKATIRAKVAFAGDLGTVVDPEPFQSDGVRRVKVAFDDGITASVLPASIEEA